MMTESQFSALSQLLRLRQGPARNAARLCLVNGMGVPEASRKVGMSYRAASYAVKRARAGYSLALAAASTGEDSPEI
jgi:hypothetical protein